MRRAGPPEQARALAETDELFNAADRLARLAKSPRRTAGSSACAATTGSREYVELKFSEGRCAVWSIQVHPQHQAGTVLRELLRLTAAAIDAAHVQVVARPPTRAMRGRFACTDCSGSARSRRTATRSSSRSRPRTWSAGSVRAKETTVTEAAEIAHSLGGRRIGSNSALVARGGCRGTTSLVCCARSAGGWTRGAARAAPERSAHRTRAARDDPGRLGARHPTVPPLRGLRRRREDRPAGGRRRIGCSSTATGARTPAPSTQSRRGSTRPSRRPASPAGEAAASSVPSSGTSTATAGRTWCPGPTAATPGQFTSSCGRRTAPSPPAGRSSSCGSTDARATNRGHARPLPPAPARLEPRRPHRPGARPTRRAGISRSAPARWRASPRSGSSPSRCRNCRTGTPTISSSPTGTATGCSMC